MKNPINNKDYIMSCGIFLEAPVYTISSKLQEGAWKYNRYSLTLNENNKQKNVSADVNPTFCGTYYNNIIPYDRLNIGQIPTYSTIAINSSLMFPVPQSDGIKIALNNLLTDKLYKVDIILNLVWDTGHNTDYEWTTSEINGIMYLSHNTDASIKDDWFSAIAFRIYPQKFLDYPIQTRQYYKNSDYHLYKFLK
jgi:hypothetical protein